MARGGVDWAGAVDAFGFSAACGVSALPGCGHAASAAKISEQNNKVAGNAIRNELCRDIRKKENNSNMSIAVQKGE